MLQRPNKLEEVINWPETERYYNFSWSVVPSVYIVANNWKETRTEQAEEMTDRELVKLAEECSSFDFLDDPEEDIYDLSDGTAIC